MQPPAGASCIFAGGPALDIFPRAAHDVHQLASRKGVEQGHVTIRNSIIQNATQPRALVRPSRVAGLHPTMLAAGRPLLLQPFTSMHVRTASSSSQSSSCYACGIGKMSDSAVRGADPTDTPRACYLPCLGNALQSHQCSAHGRSKHVAKVKPDDSQHNTHLPQMHPWEQSPGPRRAMLQTRKEKALPDWVVIRGWRMIVAATNVDIGYVETVRELRGPNRIIP